MKLEFARTRPLEFLGNRKKVVDALADLHAAQKYYLEHLVWKIKRRRDANEL
jgi:hypothetical protein